MDVKAKPLAVAGDRRVDFIDDASRHE